MKIVQINATCGVGSTGKICVDISKLLTEKGIENYVLYTQGNSDYPLGIKYATKNEIKLQALKSKLFGNYGFNSKRITKKLISELEKIKPDVVHMHNIHSHNCHLEVLFDYFRKTQIKVYWSFHDCWAFTGYCPHFDMIGCDKWKMGCHNCVLKGVYSWFFDNSKSLYERKKNIFKGVNITVVTPTQWLTDVVGESFLARYDCKMLKYGMDTDVFRPTESDFKEKYGLQNKYIVLGVAFGWGPKKGLDCFVELLKRLPEKYQIVLVGTNETVDKQLPSNIISIHRTQNQKELAEIYTAADVFVNCTREETFGLVNVEALACGTPVITFKTGGSPEAIDETCGSVVEKNDIDGIEKEVIRICQEKPYSGEACRNRALGFEKSLRYDEYIKMYLS